MLIVNEEMWKECSEGKKQMLPWYLTICFLFLIKMQWLSDIFWMWFGVQIPFALLCIYIHLKKKKKIVKWYCQLNVMQWIVRIRVRQNSYFKNWSLLVIEWICWIRHTLHRTQTGNATFLHKTQLIIWLFMPIYSLICTI